MTIFRRKQPRFNQTENETGYFAKMSRLLTSKNSNVQAEIVARLAHIRKEATSILG
jgi:hypothetical protein